MASRTVVNKMFAPREMVDDNVKSRVNSTHETLASVFTADEFNRYKSYSAFCLQADMDELTIDDFQSNGEVLESGTPVQELKPNSERENRSKGIPAIFNKLHAVPLEEEKYGWRVSQNMPLIDSPKTRRLQRSMNACTVRDLVQKSREGMLGTSVYEYSDFMFCKYLGKISNNHLITLRRYSIPVNDYVMPYGNPSAKNESSGPNRTKVTTKPDNGGIPIGTMVTWMGTPGNEMKDILKYSFNMPFKFTTSKWEDSGAASRQAYDTRTRGVVGAGFKKVFQSSAAQHIANFTIPGMYNKASGQTYSYPGPHYDPQKAYAGVDMIKGIYIRDPDQGLHFSHKFKLTFDYELRSYNGVNGKQAMLDLLGNILTTCYTTGDFWPGGYRSSAGYSTMQPTSNLECMQHHNTFSGYVKAFQHDFQKTKAGVKNFMADPLNSLIKLLDNLGGLLLGGDLDAVPPAIGQGCNALLSDSTVGFWHVTIGNPCAPILSIGNLVMTNCEVEHYGPLGIDDFPTGLRVTCEFDTGKPRDKRLIERMYNSGNDRIYIPLDQTVFETIKKAKNINQKQAATLRGNSKAGVDSEKTINQRTTDMAKAAVESASMANFSSVGDYSLQSPFQRVDILDEIDDAEVLQRIFGTSNPKALEWAAGECAEGTDPGNPPPSNETIKDDKGERGTAKNNGNNGK